MKYQDQIVTTEADTTKISTILKNEKGYKIIHNLSYIKGLRGFVCDTEFVNETENFVLTLQVQQIWFADICLHQ